MNTFPTDSIRRDRPADADQVGTFNSASGVSYKSYGIGLLKTLEFTFDSYALTMTDEAGVVLYGGIKLWDFPEGAVQFMNAIADLDITGSGGINADFDGDFGVGTVTASNNATLASTEQNILPTTATPQASGGVTTANGQSTITQAGIVIDGTTTAADLYLNFLVDDADHDGGVLTISGTLKVTFMMMGDY